MANSHVTNMSDDCYSEPMKCGNSFKKVQNPQACQRHTQLHQSAPIVPEFCSLGRYGVSSSSIKFMPTKFPHVSIRGPPIPA